MSDASMQPPPGRPAGSGPASADATHREIRPPVRLALAATVLYAALYGAVGLAPAAIATLGAAAIAVFSASANQERLTPRLRPEVGQALAAALVFAVAYFVAGIAAAALAGLLAALVLMRLARADVLTMDREPNGIPADADPAHAPDAEPPPVRPELRAALIAAVLFAVIGFMSGFAGGVLAGVLGYLLVWRHAGVQDDPRIPQVPARIGVAAFGVVVVLVGLGTLAYACFLSLFAGLRPGTFLAPDTGGVRLLAVVVGLGGGAVAGVVIVQGVAMIWGVIRGRDLGAAATRRGAIATCTLAGLCILVGSTLTDG